ncbi:hypothetical protein H072_7416 [Dactylellina haptotyla CBS 200.50]|uniref:Peptidase S8/S53 domain-containing protein n=1 Tax=Dactylellina haptotyla (strain CBS 200.50) TaxID=1284197 RepID=S8A7K3_DACHA|nr:hypothetical protein H072_7416 [Dactylellina haptotyla CBS 200.50]
MGTLHQFAEIYWFILKKEYRFDQDYISHLLLWAEYIALPPKSRNFHTTESSQLGVLSVSVEVEPNADISEMVEAFEHGFHAYERVFSDHIYYGASDFIRDPPYWIEDTSQSSIAKRQTQRTTQKVDEDLTFPKSPYRPRGYFNQVDRVGKSPTAKFESALRKRNIDITKDDVEGIDVQQGSMDIQILSQPPHVSIDELQNKFWNFKNPGKGTIIYILDSGYDLEHPEFSDMNIQDWLDPKQYPWDELNDISKEYNFYHGTNVLSKCAGKNVGVSKDATYVLARYSDGRGRASFDTIIEMILQIYDHIQRNNKRRKCVINLSFALPRRLPEYWAAFGKQKSKRKQLVLDFEEYIVEVFELLASLSNVIITTAAGNSAPNTKPEGYPAILADRASIRKNMVVIGGYNPYTGKNHYVESKWTKV